MIGREVLALKLASSEEVKESEVSDEMELAGSTIWISVVRAS